jgi:ssDNA-binding Zn-finger/Zn-ribbon topoisomerase 1
MTKQGYYTNSKGELKRYYKYLTKCPKCKIKLIGYQDVNNNGEIFTYASCPKCDFQKNLEN